MIHKESKNTYNGSLSIQKYYKYVERQNVFSIEILVDSRMRTLWCQIKSYAVDNWGHSVYPKPVSSNIPCGASSWNNISTIKVFTVLWINTFKSESIIILYTLIPLVTNLELLLPSKRFSLTFLEFRHQATIHLAWKVPFRNWK